MSIRVLIIDDEEQSRVILRDELEANFPGLKIVGEAHNVESAISAISLLQPDLVLLDVQLTDGTCFTVLQSLEKVDFHIIFITAYDQYAIKAFRANAVDYLLKPIDQDELIEAVTIAEDLIKKDKLRINLQSLLNTAFTPTKKNRIKLSTAEGIHLIDPAEIIRCKAEGNYTTFHLDSGEKLLISKTLKEVEKLLEGFHFERIHQSHIINFNLIKKYINRDGGHLVMIDGSEIPISQRKKSRLLSLLK